MKQGDLIEHMYYGYLAPDRDCRGGGDLCQEAGCRVLVRAERLAEQWPTDQAEGLTPEQREECLQFRQFAARLADTVQKYLHAGMRIAPKKCGGQMCPLGCLDGQIRFPNEAFAPAGEGSKWYAFYSGFDDMSFNSSRGHYAYYRLGQAYRKRFTK